MSNKRQPRADGVVVRALSVRYSHGTVLDEHAHDWHQLLYATKGVMLVETSSSSWVVPPDRGVWLPARIPHRVTMRGEVAMRTLYFEASRSSPSTTRVVEMSPLLRELVVHCAGRGKLDLRSPHEARLAGLLDDLLEAVAAAPLALPMPRDPRALRFARAMRDDARALATASVSALARRAGASVRTLERLFVAETGLTFGRWRQQARLLHALTLLAEGASVKTVASEVGYASPSAFIAMFKTALGTTPTKFVGG